ncbi:hypothetical protein JTB14_020763 [Gonioctena quinquepunctata]|nr:hypothetical protein JTB14_020763 [Gonioctena quinquepunctata]
MKSKLASITARQNATLLGEPSVSSRLGLRKNSSDQNSSGSILPTICIFCEKEQKYQPGSGTREELVLCVEMRSSYTIKASAISKNGSKFVGLTETK